MSERETQKPGPPIVDDQNAMLSGQSQTKQSARFRMARSSIPSQELQRTKAGGPIS